VVAAHLFLESSCSQDTITGFMLAGVGDIDSKKQTNYLTVTSSAPTIMRIVFYPPMMSSLPFPCRDDRPTNRGGLHTVHEAEGRLRNLD